MRINKEKPIKQFQFGTLVSVFRSRCFQLITNYGDMIRIA